MGKENLVTVPAFLFRNVNLRNAGSRVVAGFLGKLTLRFRTFLGMAGTLEPRGIPDVPGRYLLRKGRFPRNETGGNLRSGVVGKGGRS